MARIVLGIGTSHSPMLSMSSEQWQGYGEGDKHNPRLGFIVPPDGNVALYPEVERLRASDAISARARPEVFHEQYERIQAAIKTLEQTLRDVSPDVAIIISDDQDELLFEDVMPSLGIFWGESMTVIPREISGTASLPENMKGPLRSAMWGYGDEELKVPVDSDLGLHLVHYLTEHDFDIAHMRYIKEQTGGAIGPMGYVTEKRVTPPRDFGMPHGWAFVVTRIMNGKTIPIVPVFQNTCYPPNQPTSKRCYAFGQKIREAVEAWDSDKRVAIIASGGLSHFVTDEDLDQTVITAMRDKDGETLSNLPRHRIDSAASETLNWVTAAGALEPMEFDLIDYLPVYRTAGGTGGGWCFARWQ
jgi:3-O-methylgallate 3,4-dioxygenase